MKTIIVAMILLFPHALWGQTSSGSECVEAVVKLEKRIAELEKQIMELQPKETSCGGMKGWKRIGGKCYSPDFDAQKEVIFHLQGLQFLTQAIGEMLKSISDQPQPGVPAELKGAR